MAFDASLAVGGHGFPSHYQGLFPLNPKLGLPPAVLGCDETAPYPLQATVGRESTYRSYSSLNFACNSDDADLKLQPLFKHLAAAGKPWAVGSRIVMQLMPEASIAQILRVDVLKAGNYTFKIDFDDGVTTTTMLASVNCATVGRHLVDLKTIPAFAATLGAETPRFSMGSALIIEVLAMPTVAPVVPPVVIVPGFSGEQCTCLFEDTTHVEFHLWGVLFPSI